MTDEQKTDDGRPPCRTRLTFEFGSGRVGAESACDPGVAIRVGLAACAADLATEFEDCPLCATLTLLGAAARALRKSGPRGAVLRCSEAAISAHLTSAGDLLYGHLCPFNGKG